MVFDLDLAELEVPLMPLHQLENDPLGLLRENPLEVGLFEQSLVHQDVAKSLLAVRMFLNLEGGDELFLGNEVLAHEQAAEHLTNGARAGVNDLAATKHDDALVHAT